VTAALPSWTPLTGAAHSVALEVLLNGPLPRSELARRLDLSPQSLTRLANPLVEDGLLIESEGSYGSVSGRPTRPLDVVEDSHHFVGVKLTGDTAYGVVTTMRARVAATEQKPLRDTSPNDVVETVRHVVDSLRPQVPSVTAMGLSLGGQVVEGGHVTQAPFLEWSDVPLARLLTDAVGLPSVVDNDLLSLTRAEQWFGAAKSCDHFAVVTIGDGVGYGLVVHGQIVASPDAGLGLVGHLPLDPTGPLCPRGHQGCAMSMLSISSITSRVSVGMGRPVDYEEFLRLARAGHPVATHVAVTAVQALGRLVAAVANLAMPKKILLTGDGVQLVDVARRQLDEAIARDRDPNAEPLDIHVQHVGFNEWARGAAVTAIQAFVLGTNGTHTPSRR
jgi:predicted NBD/HSP70 family sugar kinase